jgi:hypothetical protein
MHTTSDERTQPSAVPDDRDLELTYQRDLLGLVAEARGRLAPPSAGGEELVDVPPSVRAAIRAAEPFIGVPPAVLPPRPPPPRGALRWAALVLAVGALGVTALARLARDLPAPEPAAALDGFALPAAIEAAFPDPATLPVAPPPVAESATPRAQPPPPAAARPWRARPRPVATATPTATPTTPLLMDAMTEAVRSRPGGSAPRR